MEGGRRVGGVRDGDQQKSSWHGASGHAAQHAILFPQAPTHAILKAEGSGASHRPSQGTHCTGLSAEARNVLLKELKAIEQMKQKLERTRQERRAQESQRQGGEPHRDIQVLRKEDALEETSSS